MGSPRKRTRPTSGAPDTSPIRKNFLTIEAEPGKSPARQKAELGLSAAFPAAVTAAAFSTPTIPDLDPMEALAVIVEKAKHVQKGDLAAVEATLLAQAVSLDAIFHGLALRASLNMDRYLEATETYLRLALKAQAQCRVTLETLAEIKNPQPTAFMRQANIAYGPQQVNNAIEPGERAPGIATVTVPPSRAGNREEREIELLPSEQERLDPGTARPAGARDPALATLAALDRPEDH